MTLLISSAELDASNPFFSSYKTPHQTFPFEQIQKKHFLPAMEKGFEQQNQEIRQIVDNKAEPDFANTIEALETSGRLLHDVLSVFYTLNHNESDAEIMEMASVIAEKFAKHSSEISMNAALFNKVKQVYDKKSSLKLRLDQEKLLDDTYLDFVRSGANLVGSDRDAFQQISIRLSALSEQYQQQVLKSTNAWEKHFKDSTELKGLPEIHLMAAREKAKEKGKGGYLFDLSAPSYQPFMRYVIHRDLRKEMYMAYQTRAVAEPYNNKPVILEMVQLRRKMAALLGKPSYATFALERRMANTPEMVMDFLDRLRDAYMPVAREEVAAVQGFAIGYEGKMISLEPWDWSYYSEKLREAKFNITEEALRPYFKLENVISGVFGLATKLYGITFKENKKIQAWNAEVTTYEVFDKDGSFLAVLYTDFFPRNTKQQGAWMSDINEQYRLKGKNVRPHISITMNFTKPSQGTPALLSFEEVTTLLHEFGHALHGMFSNVHYRSQSGTNVYRDFVELPSQLMENWATKKEFLDGFATHYQTGEAIPEPLIARLIEAENFNVAYACVRQLSFGYLDMAWNGITQDIQGDVGAFEKQALDKVNLIPVPESCLISTAFSHIFSGGYAAGYYSYKWSEVLDADAFEFFTTDQVFDTQKAASFREQVLSKGGTENPMVLYKRFRGAEPGIQALLKRNGIYNRTTWKQ